MCSLVITRWNRGLHVGDVQRNAFWQISALNLQVHVPRFGIGQCDAVEADPGQAKMAGVNSLQLGIDKIDPQIVTLAEFEFQLDRAVS